MTTFRRLALAMVSTLVMPGCITTTPPGTVTWYASAPPNLDPLSPVVVARNVEFDRKVVNVPAGRAFMLVFVNDEALPHNVSVYRDPAYQHAVYEGDAFDGPATRWLVMPALLPGQYPFQCDIHPIPAMQGLLVAG